MKTDVIVTGGGASGMMAAITAARTGAEVTILEQNERLGKKLLSTGNGKCNYTNEKQELSFYHSDCPEAVEAVLRQFPLEETVSFFRELGVLPLIKKGGYYPNSEQASAVLDALRFETERLNISVVTNAKVQEIKKEADGFSVAFSCGTADKKGAVDKKKSADKKGTADEKRTLERKRERGRRVILAGGSKASAIAGSDGSMYALAQKLGHKVIRPLPALVQLKCEEAFYKGLQGVRMQANLRLFAYGQENVHKTLIASETGELQLTAYGVSGIPVFQLSRFAAKELDQGGKAELSIDFLPDLSQEETEAELLRLKNRNAARKMEDLLGGLVNKKLAVVLLKRCQIKPSALCGQTTDEEIRRLAELLKEFPTRIAATNGFREAQICCGGIDLSQIRGETLESRKVPGLYFAGECLDVDGACGGYNLQWAWASGFVAGRSAASALCR